MSLVFGSVCSGIGAPETAWRGLGWRCAFMSEIDAFPRAVLSHHFQEVPLHGDFTTIQAGDYAPIDLLVGGTPCQSFSVAGLRGGMADARGNLALEFLRLADRLRPRWVVWENVPGVLSSNGGRDFGAVLGGLGECGYGFAYRVLDAQYFGLAQRRKRVFVVGYLGDWRPAAAVLFEPTSLRGDPAPRREAGERVAPTVARGSPGGRTYGLDADTADSLIPQAYDILGVPATQGGRATDIHTALRARAPGGSEASTTTVVAHVPSISPALKARDFKGPSSDGDGDGAPLIAHTLRAEGFDASEYGTGRGVPLVPIAFDTTQITSPSNYSRPQPGEPCHPLAAGAHAPAVASHGSQDPDVSGSVTHPVGRNQGQETCALVGAAVRRLTPRECERLQGFPDDYTAIPHRNGMAAEGPRYRALGNSMAVPVLRWIGRRIMAAARLQPPNQGNSDAR